MNHRRRVEEFRRIIRMNSTLTQGNEEVANYVLSLMKMRGLQTQLQWVSHSQDDISKRQFNAIGTLGDPLVDRKTKKGLLLLSPLDTTLPGVVQHWEKNSGDPFELNETDGVCTGLGVLQGKLDFLAKLTALEKLREKKLKAPVYLVGTCGFQSSFLGARYLMKSLVVNPKNVLVFSPTENKVSGSQKLQFQLKVQIGFQTVEKDARGYHRRVDLFVVGKAAHPVLDDHGKNAISLLTCFLEELKQAGFDYRLTRFQSGADLNRVPDQAYGQFFLTNHLFEDFKRFFRDRTQMSEKEKNFRVELGGLGDAGVTFLPQEVTECLFRICHCFEQSGQTLVQINQRDRMIEVRFNLFFDPDSNATEKITEIKNTIAEVAHHHPVLTIDSNVERVNPTTKGDFSDFGKLAADTAGKGGASQVSLPNEASVYLSNGFDAISYGAGSVENGLGGPNENLSVEDWEKSVQFYEKLIMEYVL